MIFYLIGSTKIIGDIAPAISNDEAFLATLSLGSALSDIQTYVLIFMGN